MPELTVVSADGDGRQPDILINMGTEPIEDEDALIDDYLERRQKAAVSQAPEARKRIDKREVAKKRETYWSLTLLVLLLGSVYVFWVLPYQLGTHPVRVYFENKK